MFSLCLMCEAEYPDNVLLIGGICENCYLKLIKQNGVRLELPEVLEIMISKNEIIQSDVTGKTWRLKDQALQLLMGDQWVSMEYFQVGIEELLEEWRIIDDPLS